MSTAWQKTSNGIVCLSCMRLKAKKKQKYKLIQTKTTRGIILIPSELQGCNKKLPEISSGIYLDIDRIKMSKGIDTA